MMFTLQTSVACTLCWRTGLGMVLGSTLRDMLVDGDDRDVPMCLGVWDVSGLYQRQVRGLWLWLH